MKIRITRGTVAGGRAFAAGDVVEVGPADWRELLRLGKAVAADDAENAADAVTPPGRRCRLRIVRGTVCAGSAVMPGDEVEVMEAEATALIRMGKAMLIEDLPTVPPVLSSTEASPAGAAGSAPKTPAE